MSLTTFSKFYYGHTIDSTNLCLDFKEGAGPELQANLNPGDYTLTEFAVEIKRALDAIGALTYTVTVDRTTRKITISSTSNFSLLVTTGTRVGSSAWGLMGFTGADKTGASSYQSQVGSGSEYLPQQILREHIPSENFKEKTDAVVNQSASGKVQVILFGTTRFIQINIKYATNIAVSNLQVGIEYQANGVENLLAFMDYLVTKAKFEYMPNRSIPGTFQKVLLERSEESRNGTAYKLKELKKGPGYFETGTLVLRVTT
jgi:hypothetical protein